MAKDMLDFWKSPLIKGALSLVGIGVYMVMHSAEALFNFHVILPGTTVDLFSPLNKEHVVELFGGVAGVGLGGFVVSHRLTPNIHTIDPETVPWNEFRLKKRRKRKKHVR